jgi:hypothetical protein
LNIYENNIYHKYQNTSYNNNNTYSNTYSSNNNMDTNTNIDFMSDVELLYNELKMSIEDIMTDLHKITLLLKGIDTVIDKDNYYCDVNMNNLRSTTSHIDSEDEGSSNSSSSRSETGDKHESSSSNKSEILEQIGDCISKDWISLRLLFHREFYSHM